MWTGELLLVTTRAGMRPEDIAFDFSWFIPAIVKYRRFLGEVLLASFFFNSSPSHPALHPSVIDKVLVHKGFTTLHVMAVGMIALALFDGFLVACGPICLRIRRTGSTWALGRNFPPCLGAAPGVF